MNHELTIKEQIDRLTQALLRVAWKGEKLQQAMETVMTKSGQQKKQSSTRKRYYLWHNEACAYLTRQELRIAHLLVQGYTQAMIGKQLHLSARTVEYYVKNMRSKLHCKNVTALKLKLLQAELPTT